jgi:hypothetical protein
MHPRHPLTVTLLVIRLIAWHVDACVCGMVGREAGQADV